MAGILLYRKNEKLCLSTDLISNDLDKLAIDIQYIYAIKHYRWLKSKDMSAHSPA
jgi:hypothetical protein